MKNDCALCTAVHETYRLVHETETTYSMIPLHPIQEGHVLVLPKRHVTMEKLTHQELAEMKDQVCALTEKIMQLHPETPPMIITDNNTKHASIPEHFHYHIIPSEVNIRKLMAGYNHSLTEKKEAERQVLERMTSILRY